MDPTDTGRRMNEENSDDDSSDDAVPVEPDYDGPSDEDLVQILLALQGNPEPKKKGRKKQVKPVLFWEVWEGQDRKWISQNLGKDTDEMDKDEMLHETEEPSDDLTIPLLRYQKEWLAWALKQEASAFRGGILADEMGMGKTLQAIALVLLKRNMPDNTEDHSFQDLPLIKGTLVICPLVAVLQWEGEIERFTLKGSTKVLVYHGADRDKKCYKLSDYDFVITTYSIIEVEYRKIMFPKEKCQYCGKKFEHAKLETHLKYACGPDSHGNKAKQSEASTSHLGQTEGMINRNGIKKKKNDCSPKKSFLHSVWWTRIILDEAHNIKSRSSKTTKAVFALKSTYRWALSGTPLQNRVEELYSLVRFLQAVPYAYYFCKKCDCRVLDYSPTCSDCGHGRSTHFCWWDKYIASEISFRGSRPGAMLLLNGRILKNLLLRRTKKGRTADLMLPPKIVILRRDSLDIIEEDYYTALYTESQAQFKTYMAAGRIVNNYGHIFELLTRLRQVVNHPYLVEYSKTKLKGDTVGKVTEKKCSVCHDPEEDTLVTSCGHVFCKSCLIDSSTISTQNSCPSCSKPITIDFTSNKVDKEQGPKIKIKGFRAASILNRIDLDHFQTSTKIEALREEIQFMTERDGSAKGIVFSQFSSFLDLIHYALQKSQVNCVRLDGSMTMEARDGALKKFNEDPNCKIFLMSLKAGGVALNLTVASHVFLMDPWWNPAVERQAMDRIHRIGQYKPIRIIRFIIENSVEERILKLQETKQLMFEGTVGGSSEALAKIGESDLLYLFGIRK